MSAYDHVQPPQKRLKPNEYLEDDEGSDDSESEQPAAAEEGSDDNELF